MRNTGFRTSDLETLYERARELLAALGDDAMLATIDYNRSNVLSETDRHQEALELLEAAASKCRAGLSPSASLLPVSLLYYASPWLGRRLGAVEVEWKVTKRWFEVTGPSASAVLPWARAMLAAAMGISTVLAARAAARCKDASPCQLARLLLVPLLVLRRVQ